MNYRITKTVLGYRVHYNCPRCKTGLSNPVAECGIQDVCPDCGQQYEVPGKERVAEMKRAAEAKKKAKQEAKRELIESRQLAKRKPAPRKTAIAKTDTHVQPQPGPTSMQVPLPPTAAPMAPALQPAPQPIAQPAPQQHSPVVIHQAAPQPIVVTNNNGQNGDFAGGCLKVILIIILAPFALFMILAFLGAIVGAAN